MVKALSKCLSGAKCENMEWNLIGEFSPLRIVCFVCFVFSFSLAKDYTVGNELVSISPPSKEFVDLEAVSKQKFLMFQDMLPSGNRLLASFVEVSKALELLQGKDPILNCHLAVQVNTKLEKKNFTIDDFSILRGSIRKQKTLLAQRYKDRVDEGLKAASRGLSKHNGLEVLLQLEGDVPLGVTFEDVNSITVTDIVKYKKSSVTLVGNRQTDPLQESFIMVNVGSIVLLNNKIFYLYVFNKYKSKDDIARAQAIAKEWVQKLCSENKTNSSVVRSDDSLINLCRTTITEEQVYFSTKRHPKAKGLDVRVQYPVSWRAEEGFRPNVVQKFVGPAIGDIEPMLTIIVKNIPLWGRICLWFYPRSSLINPRNLMPDGATFLDGLETKIDGISGYYTRLYYEVNYAGERKAMFMVQYYLIYKGKMVFIQGSLTGLAEEKLLVEEAFKAYQPLFKLIGNSIIIHNQWE